MIRWFANNSIAANFLMVAILLAGAYTVLFEVPLEVRPSQQWNSVNIEMSYRGGTAKDVEKGILIPIEEALEGVNGIKMVHADGYRGHGRMWVEAEDGYDVRVLMEDVKARVDGISTFPSETERPRIRIPDTTNWHEVLTIAVTGRLDAHELRRVAQRVQQDLVEIDGISRASLEGDRPYEIAIEADQARLEAFNLGFREIADAIRRSSIDLPAGSIQSQSGTLVVRTRGQAYYKEQFEKIPVRAADGAETTIGEIAEVKDGFEEGEVVLEFNGKPALFIEVMRTGKESAIQISDKVREYIETSGTRFPDGIEFFVYDDESISIRGRLSTLVSSLLQGCLLVMIILGLFLRPQLAFWVVIGIPVSFAGGIILMPYFGVTANLMSLFGFIIVLGLVVDDAIVTGENVYTKIRSGMNSLEASVHGTEEVTVPVTFGILTTVVAFLPLLYFEGRWGEFARQIPPIVAPVLLFSLLESKLVLPSHLKHIKVRTGKLGPVARFQRKFADGLEWFVVRAYQPCLNVAVKYRGLVICIFIAMALLMAGYCQGGRVGFVSFPSVDRLKISASLDLPNDGTIERTHQYVDRIVAATEQLKKEFVDPGTGESLIRNVVKVSGSRYIGRWFDKSRGYVAVEVMPPSLRSEPGPRNSVIAQRWTEIVGPIPEATSFHIRGEQSRGREREEENQPLELELRGETTPRKNEIADQIADLLRGFSGVRHAWARINYGQDELEFKLEPRAVELGLTQASLAQQIRQAFYGEEAQRILRETDEVRVMVRLPRKARESLHTLERLKIRTPIGAEVALSSVADLAFVKAPSSIERNDGAEVIRIGAMPIDEDVDLLAIADEIKPKIQELVNEGENLSYQFTGYIAEHEESRTKTLTGFAVLLFLLFALLAIPFKSVLQPVFVLLAVPFGIIGALLGHIFLGITPSYLSIFGILALSGVVVNDSLVLVDHVNRRTRSGTPLRQAVLESGAKRFRPILLTSLTTFAGLVPLLLDRSIQAQFLIPMAVSLGAGILFATVITLFLIPCSLLLAEDVKRGFRKALGFPTEDIDDDAALPSEVSEETDKSPQN